MADFRPLATLYPNEASLKNNNPAGISYFGDNSFTKSLTDSGIKWSPGTKRPSAEGAQYLSFDTAEDGMKAYDALWGTKKYQSMKVQDALNRWGTGNIGAKIDMNKTVSQLTPEERNQLQVAQLAKESPGFLKEMKKAGLLKESVKQKGFFERAFDAIIPSAEASSPEVNYSFNMNGNQDSYKPVSPASVTPSIKEPNFDDINGVKSFFLENGGFGAREQAAADVAVAKLGMTKEEAVKAVARRKYSMMTTSSTPDGKYSQMVNKFRSEGLNGGYEKPSDPNAAEALGRTGLSAVPLDFAGRPEAVAPEALESAKQSILSAEGGYESFANSLKGMDRKQKAAIPEDQKQAFLAILKEKYDMFNKQDPKAGAAFADWAKKAMFDLAAEQTSAMDYQTQVFGYGASADEKMDESSPLSKLVNPLVNAASGAAKGLWTGLNTLGWNPVKGLFDGSQNTAEGLSEGNLGKAASGIMQEAGNISSLGRIGAAITAGLNNLAKTDAGAAALSTVMSVPGWTAEQLVSILPGVPEEQKADYVAAIRDMIVSGTVRGTIGAYGGGKAGINASPAASSASKVGSALLGSAKQGAVEFGKGLLDPFKTFLPTKAPKVTAAQEKIVADAAKRVKDEVKNMEKNFAPNERISKEDLVRAAAAKNKFGDLTDVKDLAQAESNVASAKQGVIEQFQKEAGNSPVPFDKTQLSEGITASVKKSLGGRNLDVTTSKLVDNMVNQIWDGLTDNKGNVVGTLSDVHAMTAKMYDTILGAGKDAGVLNVNSMKSYLAIKEALYGELAKVPGFAQYLDDYRNLSRVEDLVKLAGKKSMTDVGRKSLQESMPPSWAGILGGAGITGSWGIAGSVLAASLLNRIKQGGKSVVRLNSSINKVADAMKAAGADGEAALKKALGIVDEAPLGSGVKPVSSYTSSKVIEKAKFDEKFPSNEPGQTVGTQSAPSKAEMNQQFEAMRPKPMKEPGESVGFGPQPSKAEIEAILNPKFTPKSAPAKKPVQSPEEVAKLKAEIASENAKASSPAKKAPVKKPATKPVTAPKKAPTAPKATKVPEKQKTAPKDKETAKPMKITDKDVKDIKKEAENALGLSTKARLAKVRSFDKVYLQRIAQVLKGTKSGFLADVLAELNSK